MAMSISTPILADAFGIMADRLQSAEAEISALDATLGDGDLGITMTKGFTAIRGVCQDAVGEALMPGEFLRRVGACLAEAAPSTLGTLLAWGFLKAGATVHAAARLDDEGVMTVLRVVTDTIATRGKARVGDKTILDALDPAVKAVAAALADKTPLPEALARGAEAAWAGFEGTATLQARHGRAGRYAARSIGHRDAGAYVGATLMASLADAVAQAPSVLDP